VFDNVVMCIGLRLAARMSDLTMTSQWSVFSLDV